MGIFGSANKTRNNSLNTNTLKFAGTGRTWYSNSMDLMKSTDVKIARDRSDYLQNLRYFCFKKVSLIIHIHFHYSKHQDVQIKKLGKFSF